MSGLNLSAMKKVELLAAVSEKETALEAAAARIKELENALHAASNPPAKPEGNLSRNFKIAATVVLGCGIPGLSLFLSKMSGTLVNHSVGLSLFAFALMVAVLVVSLPHLKWSISNITRSNAVPSWCLAVALDLAIVLCELTLTFAKEAGLEQVSYGMMLCVVVASMALNVWAFFKAPDHN